MPAWHVTLTADVHALATTARELRAAHQHASHAVWTTDPARANPAPGIATGPTTEPIRPHDQALRQLAALYAALERDTRDLYENASLAYAYSTAAAITAVLHSDHPQHVQLAPDATLPDLSQSLSIRAGARDLAHLRTRLLTAEEQQNPDLADTAYAYGECAERALRHLLDHAAAHGFLNNAS